MREKKNSVTAKNKVSTKSPRKVIQTTGNPQKWLCLTVILLGLVIGFQQKQIYDIEQTNKSLRNDFSHIKKVYVYNLEETLRGVDLEKLNREFEAKLNVLNEEVSIAQEKISSLKETKDKDNFSDIYLKSLKLKRDTMVQEYNYMLENLTEQINQVIAEIAKEKKAMVILDIRAVASITEDVEDVTNEVIKRVKLLRPKIMDE